MRRDPARLRVASANLTSRHPPQGKMVRYAPIVADVSSLLIVAAAIVVVYAAFVVALIVAGRRRDARDVARFIPDCIVLLKRLLGDPRVPRRHKLLLGALVGYLAFPIDLVPDFIPVAGQIDDVLVVVLALRVVLRASRGELLREHWPGPESSLAFVLRFVDTSSPVEK